MNQILFTKYNDFNKKKKNIIKKFKYLLSISILFLVSLTIYFVSFFSYEKQKEKLSTSLLNSFNIERLYSDNDDYTIVVLNGTKKFCVIGIIEIEKINIKYPILSTTNDEFLKIAPCRFYGPYPNEIGNLCIAGHNYDDNRFFSNLKKLEIGDVIKIYDSNNSVIDYFIYDKYETSGNNTSCTNQNTNGMKEITLVTCNNISKNRFIIKAKE